MDVIGEAEIVAKEVEIVAEVVEKVGTAAEKVSAKAADELPENGNLKKAALLVERISKEVVHDAQLTEDFIHKVLQYKSTPFEPLLIRKVLHSFADTFSSFTLLVFFFIDQASVIGNMHNHSLSKQHNLV